jgi:hypothetical protein
MKRKKIFNLIILPFLSIILLLGFFVNPEIIQAQDDPYGIDDMDLYLEQDLQPREAIVGIINIVLSFLGLIAVIIVIYGGFVWMTSGGDADKVDKAKKILKNGLIGLVIVLLSWGIVVWVLAQFPEIFGGGGTNDLCTPNETRSCYVCLENNIACYGQETCLSTGYWGSCVHNCDCDGGNGGTTGDSCDGEPESSGCLVDHDNCAEDYYCSAVDCTCQAKGGLGDPCNSDYTDVCNSPDDDLCGLYLTCDVDECICDGPPVITSVSPMGGFCEDDYNIACLNDNDCLTTCNINTPNGAPDNFISIFGHNFGHEHGQVLFNDSIEGVSPSHLNSNCINTWTNNQIIITVPYGETTGPLTVKAFDDRTGSTNDGIGPDINDFISNTIIRPGLCLIEPNSGASSDEISYQGVNLFSSAEAYFGNYQQNIKAIESSLEIPDEYSGIAKVPHINKGKTSTFALGTVGGILLYSNYLDFHKEEEPALGPYINSFSPEKGAPGQYVTIYGGGFLNNKGTSQVYFGDENEANYNFPEVCLHSVWTNNKVIVKVPENIDNGNYIINLNIAGEAINTSLLNPDTFQVDSSLSLAPSLCKISPIRGQAETEVSFWGEYFGNHNELISAVFHFNQIKNSQVEKEGSTDYFSAQVPAEAITGPVSVRKDTLTGNSLNFEIGPCQTDSDCGEDICCPADTYKAFRCETNINNCSIDIANSVFEWSFDTDLENLDFCQELELNDCLDNSDCCYDGKDNACISINNRLAFGEEEENAGYCKRWDCQEKDLEKPCDNENPNIDGDYINLNACYTNCNPIPPEPGISCYNNFSDNCNFPACSGSGITFSCLVEDGSVAQDISDCGVCCCSMNNDNCSDIHEVLHCQPNQEPCTGNERGLCCGCSNDGECGSVEDIGCGYDECCRKRPEVIENELIPSNGAEDVCRNATIKIPFDQRMSINSLTFNTLLLEERELDDYCPTGSLILNKKEGQKNNLFVRLINNIKQIFTKMSPTALALPSSDYLYCLVPGNIKVEQEAQRSVLYYYPSRLLKDETNYYLVVKGDEDLNSQSGVLSAWGIGMNGQGINGTEGEDIYFNLVNFPQSFISKFTTLNDQQINSGVCEIDYVKISPSSYLFNSTENDLNEEDVNPYDNTFDTARDRDKVFFAHAYTLDNQIIQATDGYRWDWKWEIGHDNILEYLNTNPPLPSNQTFIRVKSNITDANTYLEAKIDMANYQNFTNQGDGSLAQANITVFVCRNPWPAILPYNINWSPWYDNVYNYQFYYCRDDGSSAFVDDLPALIHPPVIPENTNNQLICSTTNLACEVGQTRCGPNNEGYCIWSVLAESYFFRQARPSAGTILSVVDLEIGESLIVNLRAKPDLIYHDDPLLRGHFRIYYAKDGESFSFLDIPLDTEDYCQIINNNYNCVYTVDNLENNQLYVFRASAVSRTNIETFFSNEMKAIPTDQTPPSKPSACGGSFLTETILNDEGEEEEIKVGVLFECENLDDETVKLRLYHGISANNYGQYFSSEIGQFDFEFTIDYFNSGIHHWAISAFDEENNESEKSDNFSLTIP